MNTQFQANKETVTSTLAKMAVRELDRRVNDGFDVTLLWDPETDRVFVDVEDQRHGGSFEVDVDPADALEAFYHPFAYAGRRYDTSALVIEPCPAGGQDHDAE
jgi:hypothetical protein